MPSIIISFRPNDTADIAERLAAYLRDRFPHVTLHLTSEPLYAVGENKEMAVIEKAGNMDALLILIGADWLSEESKWLTDEDNIDQKVLRIALQKRKRLVPIYVDGASFPTDVMMPGQFREIGKYAGVELRNETFEQDAEKLADSISQYVPKPAPPPVVEPAAPVAVTPANPEERPEWLAYVSLAVGTVGMCTWLLPFVGCPVSLAGLVTGILGLNSSQRTLAIVGLVLSGVGLLLNLINGIAGAYLGFTGQVEPLF